MKSEIEERERSEESGGHEDMTEWEALVNKENIHPMIFQEGEADQMNTNNLKGNRKARHHQPGNTPKRPTRQKTSDDRGQTVPKNRPGSLQEPGTSRSREKMLSEMEAMVLKYMINLANALSTTAIDENRNNNETLGMER